MSTTYGTPVGAPKKLGVKVLGFLLYNPTKMLKTDLKAYQARWAEVEAMLERERRSAPLELRWQQLNAARALAIGLGLTPQESSENEVFDRWAK